jgi:CheY-like chemotaxis protein/anti-sigma regulatory factor (Ser/Thr protein kinase)
MFATQAAAKQLALRLEVDQGAPEVVKADSARLSQIVGNLVSNAVKFTEGGGIDVAVSFDWARDRLRVLVKDTGPGIAADKRDRLFQRFSQLDGSVSRRHGGTGLGLSICKGLVELMGGEISVASTVGAGSTFQFWISARPETARPQQAAAAPQPPAATVQPSRILVVDDLAVNRLLVRAILESSGHLVEEAAGGAEAIAAAVGAPFDLILMDLQMPGMDGCAAARAIRALECSNRRTPIIALSANVLPEHIEASTSAGMNGHLAKPIVPAALMSAIAQWAGVRVGDETTLAASA